MRYRSAKHIIFKLLHWQLDAWFKLHACPDANVVRKIIASAVDQLHRFPKHEPRRGRNTPATRRTNQDVIKRLGRSTGHKPQGTKGWLQIVREGIVERRRLDEFLLEPGATRHIKISGYDDEGFCVEGIDYVGKLL
jgi:hypothetical protein